MKNKLSNILLVFMLFTGIALLLYPTISDYYNSLNQSRAVADYTKQVENMSENECKELLEEAYRYNQKLSKRPVTSFVLNGEELREYNSILNKTEIMSYIEIPSIHCVLPVYHSIDETVLNVGIGHIAGSSFPVGGKSTHCVLSGHRGLPSAKLFTDLDQVAEGDIFILRTLKKILTYKVDQIRIVEPNDVSTLEIVPGKDYCTLVTCTPYGVNTQRLLVRGSRTDNREESEAYLVMADAVQIEPIVVVPFAAIPIFTVMLIWILIKPVKRKEGFSK